MAKSKSWSVKGIDSDTRDLARKSAQAAGMTIGAWIDQAILKAKRGELPDLAAPANPDEAAALPAADPVAERQPPGTAPDTPVAAVAPLPDAVQPQTAAPGERILAADNMRQDDTTPGEDADEADNGDDESRIAGSPGPRPLAPETRQWPIARYALLAIVFVSLLAGGGWLFVELSSTKPKRPAQTAADTKAHSKPALPAPGTPDTAAPALPDEIRTGIELARAGNAKAQHDLGMLHLSGRYVKKDSTEAAEWFERAAVQGLASAQFNLGVLYQRGEGIAQNDQLAFFWYQSAADQGLARAQHNLATAYAEGKGIAQSYPKAAEWFAKSADAGLSASQYSLATIYERGLATGTPDLEQARFWYEKAAAQGDPKATESLALIADRIARETPSPTAVAAVPPRPISPPEAMPESGAPDKKIGRAEIREMQSLLARMNFNPGPADGQMGRRTADAIRLYQQFAGLETDGTPSQALLEDMRAVARSMSKGG